MDVYPVAKDVDMQGTTSSVSQSSVVKPTSEGVDVYQSPVTSATVEPSTFVAGEVLNYLDSDFDEPTSPVHPMRSQRKRVRSQIRNLVLQLKI